MPVNLELWVIDNIIRNRIVRLLVAPKLARQVDVNFLDTRQVEAVEHNGNVLNTNGRCRQTQNDRMTKRIQILIAAVQVRLVLLRLLDALPVPLGKLVQQWLRDKVPHMARPERCVNFLVEPSLGRLGDHFDHDDDPNDHKKKSYARMHTFLFAKAKKIECSTSAPFNLISFKQLIHSRSDHSSSSPLVSSSSGTSRNLRLLISTRDSDDNVLAAGLSSMRLRLGCA